MNEGEKSYLNFTLQAALVELNSNEPELAVERLSKYVDYYKRECAKKMNTKDLKEA